MQQSGINCFGHNIQLWQKKTTNTLKAIYFKDIYATNGVMCMPKKHKGATICISQQKNLTNSISIYLIKN